VTRFTVALLHASAILSLLAPAAGAQSRTGTWGFVNARYDMRASASIYTGYGWRGAFAMGGVVHNARSGYAEVLGGVGAVFRTGASAEHWLAVASARARDVSFAQVYWLPAVRTGVVTTRATVVWQIPTRDNTTQEVAVSPLSMMVPIRRWLSGGVALETSVGVGARPATATGLEVRLKLPGASLSANALHDVNGSGSRLKLSFASTF
jgi:hypothetical protein